MMRVVLLRRTWSSPVAFRPVSLLPVRQPATLTFVTPRRRVAGAAVQEEEEEEAGEEGQVVAVAQVLLTLAALAVSPLPT